MARKPVSDDSLAPNQTSMTTTTTTTTTAARLHCFGNDTLCALGATKPYPSAWTCSARCSQLPNLSSAHSAAAASYRHRHLLVYRPHVAVANSTFSRCRNFGLALLFLQCNFCLLTLLPLPLLPPLLMCERCPVGLCPRRSRCMLPR